MFDLLSLSNCFSTSAQFFAPGGGILLSVLREPPCSPSISLSSLQLLLPPCFPLLSTINLHYLQNEIQSSFTAINVLQSRLCLILLRRPMTAQFNAMYFLFFNSLNYSKICLLHLCHLSFLLLTIFTKRFTR